MSPSLFLPPLSAGPRLVSEPPAFGSYVDPSTQEPVVLPLDRPRDRCVIFDDLASSEPSWDVWERAQAREDWAVENCEGPTCLRWFRYPEGVWVPLITCEIDDDVDLLADRWNGSPLAQV